MVTKKRETKQQRIDRCSGRKTGEACMDMSCKDRSECPRYAGNGPGVPGSVVAPPLSLVAQAVHNAGVVCGYRQALGAISENLRKQAAEWRARDGKMRIVAKFWKPFDRAEALESMATVIDTQNAAQAQQEQQLTRVAESMLAVAGGGK